MNSITHKQAIQFIHRRLDGMLKANQALLLDEHLDSCDVCRTYASEMDVIPAQLNAELKSRWDADQGPSENVAQYVSAQARKIPTQQRLASAMKLVTGLAAIVVLAFFMNFMISRLQSASVTANGTPFVSSVEPVGLLAFTSRQEGNSEIYSMHADGSGLTNLTNNQADDSSPFWSPDGRQIAFISDRDGSYQAYLMNANGSNVTQLTDGKGIYFFDSNGYSPWSPDGKKLILLHQPEGEKTYSLHVLNIADKSITTITEEPGRYLFMSWSPDGTHIAFLSDTDRIPRDLFIVASDGSGAVNLTEDLPPGEYFLMDYDWSVDGSSLFFITYGNQQIDRRTRSVSTLYKATTSGSVEVAAQTMDRQIIDWWNDTGERLELSEEFLYWVRPDGMESPLDVCKDQGQRTGMAAQRSHANNVVFGSNCSSSGWTLYWSDPDGTTLVPLLNSAIPSDQDILFGLTWSFDDQHLAFISFDSTLSDPTATLYILDVAKAREDPSTQPLKIVGGSAPSWQPISNREVVEEKPTPEHLTFLLTIQQAEEQAGFDVLEPSYLPEGYAFQGAAYHPESNAVILQYIASARDPLKTSTIHIYQKRGDFPELGLPSESHATPVPIGTLMGEVTHGAWVYNSPSTTTPRWEESDSLLSLSWQSDGISFSVDYLGSVSIPLLSLDELVAIAEGLTTTAQQVPSIATNISNGEWIAFIGGKTIPDPANSLYMTTEQDVFLIHPDGSELVNITNSPDFYVWPQWSPNGNDLLFLRMRNSGTMDILRKNGSNGFDVLVSTSMSFDPSFHYSWSPNGEQIAFVDKSSGNLGIYTMYADGRNDPQITQLTDDPADDFGFVWSPDGDRIAFQRLDGDKLSIHVMNQDGSNPHEVAQGMGRVWLYWSHDGKVLYASGGSQLAAQSNWLECEGCSHNPAIYHMDPGGTLVEQIYAEPEYSQVGFHLYDTPQNTLYFMRVEPQPFLEFWGTWFRFDGTSVQQIDPLDPHQTCKTTDGNILSEDISSNQRFSIVTNFCAGGFDLYLVDRETPRPKLRHLLQLPLDTWGQGGNFAYLPITWSPDGRSIIYDDGHGSMLLLDLEKVMQDPSTQPVRFIQPVLYEGQSGQMFQSPESIFVIDLVWQPKP